MADKPEWIREEIGDFAQEMEKVMAENDKEKRDTWKSMPLHILLRMMYKQLETFKLIIQCQSLEPKEVLRKHLINISNYCMMLHHRLGER